MIQNVNNIEKNFTNSTKYGYTGVTGESILSRILIPANTFKNGDVITVEGVFDCSGSTGIDIYIGSATTIATSTNIMTRGFGTVQTYQTQSRTLHIVRANGDMTGVSPDRGTIVTSTSLGLFNEFYSSPVDIHSIDWTQDKYVFFTGTLYTSPAVRYFNQYSMKIWTY
jgi:hypothetical protein